MNRFSPAAFAPAVFFLAAILASCGMSKGQLEQELAREFQRSLDADATFKPYGMKVTGATLVKSGGRTYSGFVKVRLDDETHDIGVTVTTDGDGFIYETNPFAFTFLVPRALDRMFGQ